MFESRISAAWTEKLPYSENFRISSWSYDMEGHAQKCVEWYCEWANKTTQQLYKVSTPCIDDHHFKEEETKSVGEMSNTCSQIVLKCLYLARIGRPDILWSVNKLARSITKWTKACGKRLNRLISYIHHTSEYKQYCHVGNTAKQCRLGLFQDSDFAGDLEDSNSTSGGTLCIFGSHTFVPISWMCKKQTAVSHSSTESEIISLDAGLRLDGITADHKVLSEGCESRNHHRYAVVVQDLAIQWIQAFPCKTKTSQETQRSLQKFLEPNRKLKVICTENSLEFGKACEDLSWNHCTSTPHRSETNGIAERAVRRVKEGTSAVLLQSGLNESWWADSMECYTYLRNVTDLLSDGKTPYERRFGQPFKGPIIPFGSLVEYHPMTAKGQSRIRQFWKESFTWIVPRIRSLRGGNLEGWRTDRRHWGVGNMDASEIYSKRLNAKEVIFPKENGNFSGHRWTNQSFWKRSGTENIHLDTAATNSRRR